METQLDRLLVLVRHGQSEWNLKNLFTGWKDPGLTALGVEEARTAGQAPQGARACLRPRLHLRAVAGAGDAAADARGDRPAGPATLRDQALNERDYGDLSGLNKDDARKRWGEEQVHLWRRSYDVSPPGGESLKDTVARTLPYYVQEILPQVMRGERVLVAAHGNSLRALVMVLDRLTPQTIPSMELATGLPLVYRLNADTHRRGEGGAGGMSESLVAKPAQTASEPGPSVRMLSARDARARTPRACRDPCRLRHRRRLRELHGPFTIDDANAWWGGVIESVADDRTVLFGAYLDDALVGTVQLGLDVPPNQRHRGDVRKLLVHRDARGRGIGAALMTALETEARPARAVLLTLDTASGSAERLYERLGWTRAGVIPRYALLPDGRFCDTTIFWKALPSTS